MPQQLIGDFVAQAVIEQLEAIQIDVQQRQASTALSHALAGFTQALLEQRAVGQAGQLIVVLQIAHTFFEFAPCRQVGEEADNVAYITPHIAHYVQLEPLRIQLAIFASLNQFALPAIGLLQRFMDRLKMAPGIAAARQLSDLAALHVFLRVAGHSAERPIDRQQGVFRIKNDNAFACGFEDRGGQTALFFQLFTGADVAAGTEHANHPAIAAALHGAATVLDPNPAPVTMPEAIGNFIVVRMPLQMVNHRELHQRQVFAMYAWLKVAEHGGHVFRFQTEQCFDLRVVDFIGLQVPVPQAQLTGLKRQRQPLLTLAQRLIGLIQLKAALDDSGFEPDLGLAQFPLGLASLFDFPRQLMVELLIVGLCLLQMLNQRLILKALNQPLTDQAINLQGHDNQRHQ